MIDVDAEFKQPLPNPSKILNIKANKPKYIGLSMRTRVENISIAIPSLMIPRIKMFLLPNLVRSFANTGEKISMEIE
jgi:hypothetical protein